MSTDTPCGCFPQPQDDVKLTTWQYGKTKADKDLPVLYLGLMIVPFLAMMALPFLPKL